jgi:cytochrome c553
MDGTTVSNAGEAALCMNCHQSRQNATNYVETATGGPYFGPHEGPQADMLMGVNGVTYGQTIPSSGHRAAVTNLCVTCHMQKIDPADPDFLHGGGHTFRVMCDPDNLDISGACARCHGPITTFDLPREDYNGDGVIEGVQTEVGHLLDQLAQLLPPVGQPKSDISIDSTWTRQQLRAGYNYRFVQKDRSGGVHNTAYAVGLLKASITDLTGQAGSTGLLSADELAFYAWQVQYFGSATNPNAAPNATPAGDGVPNWLKYALGLTPTLPGTVLTNGVVWNNVTILGGATNTVHIYTAAEVVFDTAAGKTYQVQSISSLSGGWQNVGAAVQGTGASIGFLTPTRNGARQFYRVVSTP